MKTGLREGTLFIVMLALAVAGAVTIANAADALRYSCSPQVYEAFGSDRLETFSQKSKVKVDVGIFASPVAIDRVINGVADIASTAQRLTQLQRDSGYVETLCCLDPIAVIVNAECPVSAITDKQLQDVFSGKITNWKELGAQDNPITVIAPSEQTAAYNNFVRDVMGGTPIKAQIVTSTSTMVIETTRRMPCSISFTSQGAARLITHGLKKLKINGLAPEDPGYPYFQMFSFVTRGVPAGAAKQFIDFSLSAEGKDIIRKKGMIPAN